MRQTVAKKQAMGKATTTRQVSDEHEDALVKAFARWDARRSSNSGSVANDPNDVTSDLHIIECKATEGKSVSIKLADWLKNKKKQYAGRTPAMAFRFRDPHTKNHLDLILIELDEYVWLREQLDVDNGNAIEVKR